MKPLAALAITAILCTSSLPAHALGYKITHLGAGTYSSTAYAINNHGVVAGMTIASSGGNRLAATWTNGVRTDLSSNGYSESYALDLNDRGQVVGVSSSSVGGEYTLARAMLWENGFSTSLAAPGEGFSEAHGINEAGVIVGRSGGFEQTSRPALWGADGMRYLGGAGERGAAYDINEHNQIVGEVAPEFGLERAVRWDGAQWQTLAEAFSGAQALNDAGTIVGWSQGHGGAVGWNGGEAYLLADHSARFTWAHDVNNAGLAVGERLIRDGVYHATAWQNGQTLDLLSLVVGDDAGFWRLTAAYGVNDLGQIVGSGYTRGGDLQAFLLTPVPEPGQWGMLLAGLGVLAWASRTRAGRARTS